MACTRRVAAAVLMVCLLGTCMAFKDVLDGRLSEESHLLMTRLQQSNTMEAVGEQLGRKMLGQQQQQQFFTLQPVCQWSTEGGEGGCSPTLMNWKQYNGMPSSPYRRAYLMAAARLDYCIETHKAADACNADQTHRCYWWKSSDGSKAYCDSADSLEMLFYFDKNFTASIYTIPAAMTCPGSKAHEFYSCFAHPDPKGSCGRMKQCFPSNIDGATACFPKWMQSYSQQQFKKLLEGLTSLDATLYGSCAGACWAKQAKVCLEKKAQGGCDKLPYCYWDASDNICFHRTLEFSSDYDMKVRRLYAMCYDTDNKKECEANLNTNNVQFESSVVWRKYTASSEPVKCAL